MSTNLKPKALRPGDTIGVVSPASPCSPELAQRGLQFLESLGYKLKILPHAFDQTDYLAGNDQERADDLTQAFLDPDIHAIFCTRGGYGCSRLMPYLDFDLLVQHPKIFTGFSDITILHAALNRRGLPTLHSPMALTLHFPKPDWVFQSLSLALSGKDPMVEEAGTGTPLAGQTSMAPVTGEVVGGCMIMICDLIGTNDQIDMEGKIVLLEDVDEMSHRVDAMLTHLINSRCLKQATGIVIGEMTRSDERVEPTIGSRPWRQIVSERLLPLGIPTVVDYPFGHNGRPLSLPMGITAQLDAAAGTLTYMESMCQ